MNAVQLLRWQHTRARRFLAQAKVGDATARHSLTELLRAHTSAAEEHILAKLEGDDDIASAVDDVYRENEVLLDVLLELERCPADSAEEIAALVEELEEVFESHRHLEEDRLFPYIQRSWPGSMLEELGKSMTTKD